MLQLLETGRVLYALAAFCVLGILTRPSCLQKIAEGKQRPFTDQEQKFKRTPAESGEYIPHQPGPGG